MKIEWYLFEQSYLLDLNYNPLGCSLILTVDAKVTFEHPKSNEVSNVESSFEKIFIKFEGVQYLRMINSLQLRTNLNEDFGSIEQLKVRNSNSISQGLSISKNAKRIGISLELSETSIATVYSNSIDLSFLEFVSEMISFELGFEKYSIVVGE